MMPARLPRMLVTLLAVGATASWPAGSLLAQTRTQCCLTAEGHHACGNPLPQECYGRAYRILNERGMTIRQVEAPLTPEQRAQRATEQERKKQEMALAHEQRRRDDALLAAYASEKDIDAAQGRASNAIQTLLKELQSRQAKALQEKQTLTNEQAFYKNRPLPEALRQQIKANATELQSLHADLATQQQELAQLTARYEADRQRYLHLKTGDATHNTSTAAPANRAP